MSYEILYNKQFLKTQEGKYIPIILNGSNNCSERTCNGRERRARSWSICNMPHWCNYKIDFTEAELLAEQTQWIDHEELFVHNGKSINGLQWLNLIKRAIKDAKTIEELLPHERPAAFLTIWRGDNRDWTPRKRINTSQELQNFIEAYNAEVIGRDANESIYPNLDFLVEKFEHQRITRERKPKERLENFYAIIVNNGENQYYLRKLTARKLLYGFGANFAKQFRTESEAQKWLEEKKIDKRFGVTCSVQAHINASNSQAQFAATLF